MVTTDWRIAKSNLQCKACETRFKVGDTYYSLLRDQGNEFERNDFCPACFQEHAAAGVYSFWKTTVPEEEEEAKPKAVLDVASVLEFFRRLAAESDPQRVAFRYVLALMLTRKKVLRLKGGDRNAQGADVLLFSEGRGGETHEVVQPDLNESEVAVVSAELGRLLGVAPPAQAAGAEAPGEAQAEVPPAEQLSVQPAG
ncbi:MAG: hypothetical protein KIS92_14910 [Planctomycetota bacterium]|nr:hypothetical protein [Planctomycetota bacterium]